MAKPLVFNYEDIPTVRDPRGRVRPGIRLVLEHNRITLPLVGLLDSGSDISFSFAVLGLNLGIKFDPSQLTSLSGIGEKEELAYKFPVNIWLGDYAVPLLIHWINRPFNSSRDLPLAVGRDFFEHFDVTFRQKAKQIILEKV